MLDETRINKREHPILLKLRSVKSCKIIRRINRFVVEIIVDNRRDFAHINNTGRLQEYLIKGKEGFCLKFEKPKKTKYRLFSIAVNEYGALIDTWIQGKAFEKALDLELIPWLHGYKIIKRNVKLNNSMIDYLIKRGDAETYLELKSAVQRIDRYASYPDAPSIRARRQLRDLIRLVENGGKAIILFIVGLRDVEAFKPNKEIDPKIHQLLLKGSQIGLKIKAIGIYYDPKGSTIKLWNPDMKIVI